jgi:hypothetical protein
MHMDYTTGDSDLGKYQIGVLFRGISINRTPPD